MPLTIYRMLVSPPSRAALMLVDLLGLDVEIKDVNLAARCNYQPEYRQKNPLHTVPLLEDDDLTLADSHAIMTYLVPKYGNEEQQKLYPEDLKTRAVIDQRLFFDATILYPRLRTVIYSGKKKRLPSPTQEQSEVIIEAYGVLEKYLETSRFVATDYLTVADISCVATVSSLDCLVPIDKKYVKIREWWLRLQKEEWYLKENASRLLYFDNYVNLYY